MTADLAATSRFLAYLLRHHPETVGLRLDPAGWVTVDDLLAALSTHGRPISMSTLEQIVAGTDKRRFELHDGRIRAAQGHSVPVELNLPPAVPPAVLYHGTSKRFLPRIRAEGLTPQRRTHVHLSADIPTATAVGARRGHPTILTIDAHGMHHNGYTFHQATNGVWLTNHVPPTWLSTPGP